MITKTRISLGRINLPRVLFRGSLLAEANTYRLVVVRSIETPEVRKVLVFNHNKMDYDPARGSSIDILGRSRYKRYEYRSEARNNI